MSNQKLSAVEHIKLKSDGLRGTLKDSLENPVTGALYEDDQSLIKFHGLYQQDDRDRREERSRKKLEWLFSFMIRLRLPGGFLSPDQWKGLHHIAGEHSTGVIKITTRETIQLHGILKSHIKPTIGSFNTLHLDSIAACGDVNRNVICSAHPGQSVVHEEIFSYAEKISRMALPKTNAYYEIWLDKEPLAEKVTEQDELYQNRYLPRKFKIAIAIPPNNDVDVFTNDVGLIAIIENENLKGFNIVAGGGLGTTHGNANTYPRLASMLGFADKENVLKVVFEIITIQRDFGNRSDRKLSRLKYTIDKLGIDPFRAELEKRCGFTLEQARWFEFTERKDFYGWHQNHKGRWYYTIFIENGLVLDNETLALKTALFEIAKTGKANFRFTANQNLILADISKEDKNKLEDILCKFGIIQHTENASLIRKNAMACVAFNTCPLALAEGQRYLPALISKIEPIINKNQLQHEEITIRMTGCPNGCARPYVADIGLIGSGYGQYNLHLGADQTGQRLNVKYRENLSEAEILNELDQLFLKFSRERNAGEYFGDFIFRNRIV